MNNSSDLKKQSFETYLKSFGKNNSTFNLRNTGKVLNEKIKWAICSHLLTPASEVWAVSPDGSVSLKYKSSAGDNKYDTAGSDSMHQSRIEYFCYQYYYFKNTNV